MSGSTIGTSIGQGITLGVAPYESPLTITNAGTITGTATYHGEFGQAGVASGIANAMLLNAGHIFGGDGGRIGGGGVSFKDFSTYATTVINSGLIQGGSGPEGAGDGISSGGLSSAPAMYSYVLNTGTLRGGNGPSGGTGASLQYATIVNSGTIDGGNGTLSGGGTGLILSHGLAVNHGLIAGGGGSATGIGAMAYGDLNGGGTTLVNDGTITGATGAALQPGPVYGYSEVSLINTGTIDGTTYGVSLAAGSTLINAGLITGGTRAIIMTSTAQYKSRLVLDEGARISGQVSGTLTNNVLELATGSLASTGSLGGLGGSITGFGTIIFDTHAAWTLGGNTTGLASGETIAGFALGDTIDLTNFLASSETFVAGTGLVLSDGGTSETLGITGNFTTADFTLSSDLAGGTNIALAHAPCFAAGTRIATDKGKVPVENLAAGDRIKSMRGGWSPIKWIGRRCYDGRFIAGNPNILPVRIRRHALGFNVPSRDLVVSPDHAICEGGMLIHAWRLINGVSITQAEQVERIEYFHIELDRHDVIFAENCPAESFLDTGCRNRFQNAADYERAFPGPFIPQPACLPRLEQGLHLAIIQRRLAARAGIAAPSARGGGILRGALDEAGPQRVRGWAQDMAAPTAPVLLDIFAGGVPQTRVLANYFRPELRAAGLGNGCFGFECIFPAGLSGTIEIRRATDGAVLPASQAVAA